MNKIRHLFVFFALLISSLPAQAQSFDPDDVILEYQSGDGAQHTRTANEILQKLADGDSQNKFFLLISKLGIENESVDYILFHLPPMINPDTGELNKAVLRALEHLKDKGQERLKIEMLSALSQANEKDLHYLVQQRTILTAMQEEAIVKLQQIIMEGSHKKETQRYATMTLEQMDQDTLAQFPIETDWLLPLCLSIEPNDDHPRVMIRNLAKIWPYVSMAAEEMVPVLYESENKFVRVLAVKLIKDEHITPEVPFAFVELLFKAAIDSFAKVRSQAMDALLERDELEKYAVDYLIESIMDGNDGWKAISKHYRFQAFEYLQKVDDQGTYALEKLSGYYDLGYERQKVYAIWSMGMIRSQIEEVKKILEPLQAGEDEAIVQAVTGSLDCLNARMCRRLRVRDGNYMFELYGANCQKSKCYVAIPGPEQFIVPDENVVTYKSMFREDEEDEQTRSLSQLINEISAKEFYGVTGINEAVYQIDKLSAKQKEYILEQLPSALDESTGNVNWAILGAIRNISRSHHSDELSQKAKERLTEEVLNILDNGAHYSLEKAIDEIKFIEVDDTVIIEKLKRIVYEESYPSEVHRAARFHLKADYGVEATRKDKYGRPLL